MNLKKSIEDSLYPLIKELGLKKVVLSDENTTYTNNRYGRLISVAEHSPSDVVIVIRDAPELYSRVFAEDVISPLLSRNGICFTTSGYQQWNAKTVYKIVPIEINCEK